MELKAIRDFSDFDGFGEFLAPSLIHADKLSLWFNILLPTTKTEQITLKLAWSYEAAQSLGGAGWYTLIGEPAYQLPLMGGEPRLVLSIPIPAGAQSAMFSVRGPYCKLGIKYNYIRRR